MSHHPLGSTRAAVLRGCLDSIPFLLVYIPFGMLFGIAGTAIGLTFLQIFGFSAFVVAGAAQFTAIELMGSQAATIMVLVTSVAVNLRMVMYSASLASDLAHAKTWQKALIAYTMTDQGYALAAAQYEAAPNDTVSLKVAYFLGASLVLVPVWLIATVLGALFGQALPEGLALDFAVPVTFLAMIGPALRSIPHLVAVFVSCTAALAFIGLPAGTGIIAAAILAMFAGGTTETIIAKRRAARGERV